MALRRRSARFSANIWPGFVDAMTALLLVLIFVLSIFMIVQSVLRSTVSDQEDELLEMGNQIASLAEALGLEQQRSDQLETRANSLDEQLADSRARSDQQSLLIASLTNERDALQAANAERDAQIASFEAQVASLLAQNTDLTASLRTTEATLAQAEQDLEATQSNLDATARDLEDSEAALVAARASISDLEAANSREISQKEALQWPWRRPDPRLTKGLRRHVWRRHGERRLRR